MEKRNYQQFKFTSIWQEADDDIIFWNYSPNTIMDIDVAKELVANRLEYMAGRKFYTVVDVTNLKSVTKEAREYMSHPDFGLKDILAGAFISNKPVTTMVVNFFLLINRPLVPAKFFTNKEDAMTWLRQIKKESIV